MNENHECIEGKDKIKSITVDSLGNLTCSYCKELICTKEYGPKYVKNLKEVVQVIRQK